MKWETDEYGVHHGQAGHLRLMVWVNDQGKCCWEVKCSACVLQTGVGLGILDAKDASRAAAHYLAADVMTAL